GECEQILVYHNKQPVGTGRIRVVDDYGKLERVCTLKLYRKSGLGKVIITALEKVAMQKGLSQVKLHGQTQAEDFYQKLGYRTVSNIFMEDGIPHILMQKDLFKYEEAWSNEICSICIRHFNFNFWYCINDSIRPWCFTF